MMAVFRAKPFFSPRPGISTITASPAKRVVEVNLVSIVIRVLEAIVAKHARVIPLTRLASPYDIVFPELVSKIQTQSTVYGEWRRK